MLEEHLEKLRAFYLVVRQGSFLKAATELGITQPAVTKSIKRLEDELGTSLFIRHRRGVVPTKAGESLNQFCETFFLKVRDVEKRVKSDQQISGVVRIGTYETLGELFWPVALRKIQNEYPNMVIELKTHNSESIWNELELGQIDLIVDAEPRTADHLYSKVLYADYFQVFCKRGTRFTQDKKNIPISYVKKAVDRNQISIEQHLRKQNLSIELLYEVESFTMVRSFLLQDVCIAVLPLRIAEEQVNQGKIIGFHSKPFGEHRICITCLDASKTEPRIVALMSILKLIASDT